jgi:hypothetical protein
MSTPRADRTQRCRALKVGCSDSIVCSHCRLVHAGESPTRCHVLWSPPLTPSFPCRSQQRKRSLEHRRVCCRQRASHRRLPRVLVRCRCLILELHHDAPVPSSPTTSATRRSSGLAPAHSFTEPPPPPRGENLLVSPSSLMCLKRVPHLAVLP